MLIYKQIQESWAIFLQTAKSFRKEKQMKAVVLCVSFLHSKKKVYFFHF